MATIKQDIIQGNGARLTAKGWEFERVFIASNFSSNGDARLIEAVQSLNIVYGDAHPAMSTAFATDFSPESMSSNDTVRVTVKYREYSQNYLIEIGTRKLMKPTTEYCPYRENNDTLPMLLYYKFPDDYELDDNIRGKTKAIGVKAKVQTYYPTLTITRTEFVSIGADTLSGYGTGLKLTGQMLIDRGKLYNGRLNQGHWNLRYDDPMASWRCEITSQSAEEGLAYRVRYSFEYDEDLWNFPATFKDPYTGEPVPDIDTPCDRPSTLPVDWAGDDLMTSRIFPMFQVQNFSLLGLVE